MTETESVSIESGAAPEANANDTGQAPVDAAVRMDRTRRSRPSSGWSIGLALLIGLILLANFLTPRLQFLFDTLGNFQWQWVVLLLILASYQGFRRRWFWMSVCMAIAFFPLMNLVSLYVAGAQPPAGQRIVRIMWLNILQTNEQYDAICKLIDDVDPDMFCLAEMTHEQLQGIESATARYEHVFNPAGISRGNVIFSKIPLTTVNFRGQRLRSNWLPMAAGRIDVDGQQVMIFCCHTTSPTLPDRLQARDNQLGELHEFAQVFEKFPHLIFLGDMNSTTHSHALSRILRQTRLRDTRKGFGLQNTWPAWLPPLRICIDHCFVSENVHVHRRWVERNVGSDHYPIVVELSFNPPR